MNKKNKKITVISFIFVSFVLINMFTSPATLERGDNYYEIVAAKGILKYNLHPLGDYSLFQQKDDVILNHFPLFNYFLAAIMIVFTTPLALNFVGLVFILTSAFLVMRISKIIKEDISDKTQLIIFSIFLFIPMIVQGTYLVDLDIILPFFMLLFTYFYLKNPNKIVLNSILFSLIWITKIQGVPIVVISILAYLVISKKPKKEYFKSFQIILFGSLLFFILVFLYAFFFDVSFSRMFAHSSIFDILLKQLKNPVKATLTSAWSLKQLVFWILPSTAILYLAGLIYSIKTKVWRKNQKLLLPLLISIFALLELIPIGTYGWNFPKYYLEFIPFMVLGMIPLIEKIRFNKKDLMKIFILVIIILIYFFIIPDPYLPEVDEAFTEKNLIEIALKVLINFDLLILPLVITFLFYRGWNADKKDVIKILIIASMIISLSVGIVQITRPYSTNNLYGDSHEDLQKTLEYLKQNTNSSDLVFVFNHVGYYFGNDENSNWYNSMLCYNSEKCMENAVANKEIKFMQFYPKDLERLNGNLKEVIEKEFYFDKRFGGIFDIYQKINKFIKRG